MLLTFKVKHDRDFSVELARAKQVAQFAIVNRNKLSSKNVSHIGLPSTISNQVLRKYGRSKKCQEVHGLVNLTIPNQAIKLDTTDQSIRIPCFGF